VSLIYPTDLDEELRDISMVSTHLVFFGISSPDVPKLALI
jgi:hypothetical protein